MSENRPESSSNGASETPYDSPAELPASADKALLQRILEQTMADDAEPLAPAELDTLKAVARRHRHEAFELEPIGVALVDSMLSLRLAQYDSKEEKWRGMSQQVATAFFESSQARQRLKRLWDRLCESTS